MDYFFVIVFFFSIRLSNGSFNGAIGRLIRYETDVVFTGFFVRSYMTPLLDFSPAVYTDSLCCYAQKAERVPQSIVLLYSVENDIWVSFFSIGFVVSLIWMAIRSVNVATGRELLPHSRKGKVQWLRIWNDTWITWVGKSLDRLPPFHSERALFISVSLVSVIFRALWESSLATAYIRPIYYKDINTLEELDKSNLTIYVRHKSMFNDIFNGSESPVYRRLNKKIVFTKDHMIRKLMQGTKAVGTARASQFNLENFPYVLQRKIHMIPECPKDYHIAYVFPKDSVFEFPINRLLLKFLQAGLIDKWIRDNAFTTKIRIMRTHNTDSVIFPKELTLHDLQFSFYTIIMGCVISTFALFCECLIAQFTIKNKLN